LRRCRVDPDDRRHAHAIRKHLDRFRPHMHMLRPAGLEFLRVMEQVAECLLSGETATVAALR
jgi:hypothetical protein